MKFKGILTNGIQIPLVAAFLSWTAFTSGANEVGLTANMPYVDILTEGGKVRIERIQDQENILTGGFAKTSRKCPPFCIQPQNVAPGVKNVAEMELLDFMLKDVAAGTGILVDARTPTWHQNGTIPGSINVPFTACAADIDDPNFQKAMDIFGVKRSDTGQFDFTNAKDLVMYCNGPWCGQSPRAIKGLIKRGYPPSKLFYYRGGMQLWNIMGLTTTIGISDFN